MIYNTQRYDFSSMRRFYYNQIQIIHAENAANSSKSELTKGRLIACTGFADLRAKNWQPFGRCAARRRLPMSQLGSAFSLARRRL